MPKKQVLYWNGRPVCDGTIVELDAPIPSDENVWDVTADDDIFLAGHKLLRADGAPLKFGSDTGSAGAYFVEVNSQKGRIRFINFTISRKGMSEDAVFPEWIRILIDEVPEKERR